MISVKTAAQMTRTSKTTVQRHIKTGKLSATRNESGEWEIDPAELARVMTIHESEHGEPMVQDDAAPTPNITSNQTTPATESQQPTGAAHGEPAHHTAIAELMQARIDDQQATIDDLRSRLDRSESERQKTQHQLAGLLTHHAEPKRRRFRLFG